MTRSDPKRNHLLASLPAAEWKRWLPQLELVQLTLGEVLYEPGSTMTHVYFPTTSIVSMLYVMKNGESAEIAVVGFEGLIGIPLFMGGESTSSRAVVQDAGQAYRLPAAAIKKEFEEAPVLHLLLRFTQALIAQMVQTAAFNKHHTLEQQLCRWLLLILDRLPTNELVMTQQLIANMLGVKQAAVLGCRAEAPVGWPHSLQSRPYHRPQPLWGRGGSVRVLSRGTGRVRTPVASPEG
jgi:CRP-like cAMP-binding protein